MTILIGLGIGACGWIVALGWWCAARAWKRAAEDTMAFAVCRHEQYLRAESRANALERLLERD